MRLLEDLGEGLMTLGPVRRLTHEDPKFCFLKNSEIND